MSNGSTRPATDVALDNDIILKGVCYGLVLWPDPGDGARPGILGEAKYVVGKRIDRAALSGEKPRAHAALANLVGSAEVLEPTEEELRFAATLERTGQERDLDLDAGESLLAAIAIERSISLLETGDKRAIASLEALLTNEPRLETLCGRVRCLEQAMKLRLGTSCESLDEVAGAVCAEPDVEKALSICFSCASGGTASCDSVLGGLDSYIAALRKDAAEMLEP